MSVRLNHAIVNVFRAFPERRAGRLRALGLGYWADPGKRMPGEINHHFGGRGVYFEEPGGHFLELITRPYA